MKSIWNKNEMLDETAPNHSKQKHIKDHKNKKVRQIITETTLENINQKKIPKIKCWVKQKWFPEIHVKR